MSFRHVLAGTVVLLVPTIAVCEVPEPLDQVQLKALVADDPAAAFLQIFDAGDDLTEARFTARDGVGARVSATQRFTRIPRADLTGDGDWAMHEPRREGGPQAQSCITCHAAPLPNGAGGVALNVAVDPLHTGDPALLLERNTLHLFGLGAVQRIAEEMTVTLQGQKAELGAQVCDSDTPAEVALEAKGTDFGILRATPTGTEEGCAPEFDTADVEGVDPDLVVRMFGWKGTHATIRDFSRGAAHNEMGMQGDELVGSRDGDHDGVTGELSVGDLTAIATYIAALERPTARTELADLGLVEMTGAERAQIARGEAMFAEIGCASCHRPVTVLEDPVFREPSATPGFFDVVLPSGDDPTAMGLDPATPVAFDLSADQPNNRIQQGETEVRLGAFLKDAQGRTLVAWFSDFRRHDMGDALADPMDAHGFGASVWPTRSLAGVGSTGPWLHDGRATTLEEAIDWHGGEALAARDAFLALTAEEQAALVAFLDNLVIANFDPEDED